MGEPQFTAWTNGTENVTVAVTVEATSAASALLSQSASAELSWPAAVPSLRAELVLTVDAKTCAVPVQKGKLAPWCAGSVNTV